MTTRSLFLVALMLALPASLMAQTSLTAPPGVVAPAPVTAPEVAGSIRVKQLIGDPVYTDGFVRMAQVREVVLLPAGALAILEVSGAYARGGPWVAVPVAALSWNAERKRLVLPGATEANLLRLRPFDFSTLPRSSGERLEPR